MLSDQAFKVFKKWCVGGGEAFEKITTTLFLEKKTSFFLAAPPPSPSPGLQFVSLKEGSITIIINLSLFFTLLRVLKS